MLILFTNKEYFSGKQKKMYKYREINELKTYFNEGF